MKQRIADALQILGGVAAVAAAATVSLGLALVVAAGALVVAGVVVERS